MKKIKIFVIFLFFLIASINIFAAQNNSGISWNTSTDSSLTLTLSTTICPASTGVQTLTVRVYGFPSASLITNADVNARIQLPDTTTTDINFTNNGNGTYSYDFNFTQTGTNKIDINASAPTFSRIGRTYYVYVQNFSINSIFLNNNTILSSGATGTIRNSVTNSDGNAFVDINGLTTIYYPSGSTFAGNGAMTDLGTGEYIYAFTVPSTSGTYTVASTFSCGSKSDSNSAGRFSVPSSGGTGGTGSTGGIGGETGGGGVSGGGSGRQISGKILSIDLDELKIGVPSKIRARVLNSSNEKTSFYVEMKINQGTLNEFETVELVSQIPKNEEKELEFISQFTPTIAGSHVVTARLLSINKQKEYDKLAKVFDIVGEIRFDVATTCLTQHVLPGTQVDASIFLKNLGNYYEDSVLEWWVENSNGKIIGKSEYPLALYTNEEKTLAKSVALPSQLELGNYLFKAQLKFREEKKIGSCSFVVEREPEYYGRIAEDLQNKTKELSESLNVYKSQGFDTGKLENKLAEINSLVEEIKLLLSENNFSLASEKIEKLKLLLEELDKAENSTGVQAAFPQIPIEWIEAIAAITLIIATGAILWGKSDKESLLGFGKGNNDSFERFLGFD